MDPSTMSIKQLKQVLIDAKMPIPSGIEKPELVSLVQRALASRPKDTFGFPRVHYFGRDIASCKAIFIFFHGYGADELQFTFLETIIDREVAVACPKSPDEGWWPLNVGEWAFALQTGTLLDKIKETPRGLKEARQSATRFVQDLRARAPSTARLFIGGFSQGAVMAMDLALSLDPDIPIFVGCFSPFIVDMEHWTERAKAHKGQLQVLLTHGKADPLIPYMASEMLNSLLSRAGVNVRFESHGGGHTLGDERIMRACGEFFDKVLT